MGKAAWHELDLKTVPLFKPEDTPWMEGRFGEDVTNTGKHSSVSITKMDFNPIYPLRLLLVHNAQTIAICSDPLYKT